MYELWLMRRSSTTLIMFESSLSSLYINIQSDSTRLKIRLRVTDFVKCISMLLVEEYTWERRYGGLRSNIPVQDPGPGFQEGFLSDCLEWGQFPLLWKSGKLVLIKNMPCRLSVCIPPHLVARRGGQVLWKTNCRPRCRTPGICGDGCGKEPIRFRSVGLLLAKNPSCSFRCLLRPKAAVSR